MRTMRTGAILIGLIFGTLNLLSFIGETYEHRDHALHDMGISDVVLWITGPLTRILATYWLIAGGVITTVLLMVRLIRTMMLRKRERELGLA